MHSRSGGSPDQGQEEGRARARMRQQGPGVKEALTFRVVQAQKLLCGRDTESHLPAILRFLPKHPCLRNTEEKAKGVSSSIYGCFLCLFLLSFLILGVMDGMFVSHQDSRVEDS